MKNLVFDVNVILDLWLARRPEADLQRIAALMRAGRRGNSQGWVVSSSLHVLEYPKSSQRRPNSRGRRPSSPTTNGSISAAPP
ncbi:MAG: hypothetical protein AADX96_26845 [Thiocapsa sp. C3-sup]|uniref:hypothetical protein n=1 Tax=unclassified Thiocapsa TaxID=2641286 RepID=UPI0035AE030F